MTAGRCDDPNCTCRADEFRFFSNPVLIRDAAKTDKIVIPLIGGVLARCFLARDGTDPEAHGGEGRETTTQSLAILDLAAQADRNKAWGDDKHAYGLITSLVLCGWPGLLALASFSYHRSVLGALVDRIQPGDPSAALRFLNSKPPPSWTESVIISALSCFASASKERSVPILDRNGRRFRVALADRLRREGLVTWPRVLAAAVNDWTVPTLERLAVHHAAAGDAAIELVTRVQEKEKREKEAERDRESASPPSIVGASSTEADSGEAAAAEQLVEDAVIEIERWRQQKERVQRERDLFAGRDTRLRSRAESLERELRTARAALERSQRELANVRGERDRLAERLAAQEAIEDDAPSSPIPPTVFTNRRILLFTGQDSADARAALEQGFWELGAAQVDCYWTDKARGPDTFPADALIAADVKFMDHSDWHSIQDRARSAGAWCYSGKHGAATMARAVAAAWLKHQEHTAG